MDTVSAAAPAAPVRKEPIARVLSRLRLKLTTIDLFVNMAHRGIWGFSFVYGPHAALYTRLHVTDDYNPVSCRVAEHWFETCARDTLCATLANAGVPDYVEVAGVYFSGFRVHHIRDCY